MNRHARPSATLGSQPPSPCVAIRCPSGYFSAVWPWSRFSSAIDFCAGIGGCYEAADQSDFSADGAVFFTAVFAFVVALLVMRRLRKGLIDEDFSLDTPRESESLPLHTYHAVIQQLKQQKHELQSLQQSERRRAKTSESISAAVLSNLPCGVVFFTANGLVRQANGSAKHILGFASLVGMSAAELFRDADLLGSSRTKLAEAVQAALQEKSPYRRLEAEYVTPRGEERELEITV